MIGMKTTKSDSTWGQLEGDDVQIEEVDSTQCPEKGQSLCYSGTSTGWWATSPSL